MLDDAASGSGAAGVPILVHIGLQKTGTTWLQHRVFRPAAGSHIVLTEERDLLRGNFSNPDWIDFSAEAARARLQPLIDEANVKGRPLVLSDEALAGFPYHNRFRREITLTRIHETLPEAMILLTVREQASIIYSMYGHYLRGGYAATLPQFLKLPEGDQRRIWNPILDRRAYDYTRFLEWCDTLFGPDRVFAMPMEWMIGQPEAFVAAFRDKLGIELPPIGAETPGEVLNPALSSPARRVQRVLNLTIPQDIRWQRTPGRFGPNRSASRFDRLVSKDWAKRSKSADMKLIRDTLGDHYAASNAALAERTGIDLAALGYRVA